MISIDYEIVRFSGEYLTKKINRLIDMDMMYTEEDLINLTGILYLFETPLCSN